jgi:hypothetical protein
MTEHLQQDRGEDIPNPTTLIDDCMDSSMWSVGDRLSSWNSIICLLDEFDRVNGNWTKEEHNTVKRFLKGFVKETVVIERLSLGQRVTVNWLLSNGGEDIGELSEEEKELVKKWVGKFEA